MTPTVDPASPANLLDARTNTRPSFARHEFCETCGLEYYKSVEAGFFIFISNLLPILVQ